jgi:hypothetical protein
MISMKATRAPAQFKKDALSTLDGRARAVRELRARWNEVVSDLGGLSELSSQKQSLIWRFVFLESWIEEQERRMLQGEGVEEARWLMALNSFTGLLARIGLERKARVVSPIARLRQQQSPNTLPMGGTENAQPRENAVANQGATIEVTGVSTS